MPVVTRWMLRSAFVCMLAGITLGALMLLQKAYPINPAIWALLPLHIELLTIGWIVQFTMGTAYWILPRYLGKSKRGKKYLAYLMVFMLNGGLGIVLVGRLLSDTCPINITALGRLLELASVLLFIALHWKRVVTYNK